MNLVESVVSRDERGEWQTQFCPHRWFRGGWLQTISTKLLRPTFASCSWAGAREICVNTNDGSNDCLTGVYATLKNVSEKPLVILMHGMGGHAESGYMRSMAGTFLQNDFPVLLWNHRGAGSSASFCRQMHHPGRTEDFAGLLAYLHEEQTDWCGAGICAVAVSLGSNVLLHYLAQSAAASQIRAAVVVSPPLNLAETSAKLKTGMNRIFERYLLHRQRTELLRSTGEVTGEERQAIQSANSIWELDDQFTAPRYGYESAEQYYREVSTLSALPAISTPTLLIHAADDPIVNKTAFERFSWAENRSLYPVLCESGGHIGFLAADGSRWHETTAVRFFDSLIFREQDQHLETWQSPG